MSAPLRTAANSIAYVLLFLVFLTLFWGTFAGQLQGQAIKVHSTIVEVPILKSRGRLVLVFDSDRTRLCETNVNRYILRVPDNTVFMRENIVGGVLGIGRAKTRVELVLPDLPRGHYIYRGFVNSDCGGSDKQTAQQPDGKFEIVE